MLSLQAISRRFDTYISITGASRTDKGVHAQSQTIHFNVPYKVNKVMQSDENDVFTYIHAYIHTCIHTYMHAYIHKLMHTYVHVCMYVCMYT